MGGLDLIRTEIWNRFKRELLRLKWVGNTTRRLTPSKERVRRRLFGVRLLILHFIFQFSKSIQTSTFHIFFNLTYHLRKKYLIHKMSKNHPTIYTKPRNIGEFLGGGISHCLKRERDIDTKATLSDVKTAFR